MVYRVTEWPRKNKKIRSTPIWVKGACSINLIRLKQEDCELEAKPGVSSGTSKDKRIQSSSCPHNRLTLKHF